jgi:uncharacterized protein YpuA (DUF1002 family)
MSPVKKLFILFGLLAVTLMFYGCAAAVVGGAAGAGAVLYSKGELKSAENAPLEEVYDAAVDTMKSMNFDVINQEKNQLEAKLVAKADNGDNIDIKLEQKPNDITEMKIRVGAFGNEDQARVIQEKIHEILS